MPTIVGILTFMSRINYQILRYESEFSTNFDYISIYEQLKFHAQLFYICGDFNGRCGNLEDYIAGIDHIPERDVIDYTINKEGERLCDFLVDSNCCIMNGRNCKENNFTFVSTQGASVVDYCITPYEHMSKYEEFTVCLTSDLLTKAMLHNKINSTTVAPDHSLLLWTFTVECANVKKRGATDVEVSYEKYDRFVPENFLQEDLSMLNEGIRDIQQSVNAQEDLDNVCKKLIKKLKDEMKVKMTHRTVKIHTSGDNKKRKVNKPWWSDSLSELWNEQCKAEKDMLKGKKSTRTRLRHVFATARKRFNREIQRTKRQYLQQKQAEIDDLQSKNQTMFWKEIGKIGVGQERRKNIPFEILRQDGSVSSDVTEVLGKWQSDFESLLNPIESTNTPGLLNPNMDNTQSNENISGYLQDPIQMSEIEAVLKRMKSNKATGIDEIPMEVLQCRNIRQTLCDLFNKCFSLGKIPNMWKMGIITPVPKSSTSDTRDPLSYRGIHITPAIYKLYCNVLNDRLTKWEAECEILNDSQNGFRKGRSTVDHILTLTSIIETRKLKRQSTFAAFIDFKKAYDAIDRTLLFTKLTHLGITSHMYNAISSLYDGVQCCVRINGLKTNWFTVNCGLKQGCSLSTLLFNLYINDLVDRINSTNKGIDIDGERVAALLYADDLVLLATSEQDLQIILNELGDWCNKNKMTINEDKSNIVHFRTPSVERTNYSFTCGNRTLMLTDKYKYLGLILTEFLCYEEMAKNVAKSASRALGIVIAKYKSFGGLPFNTYIKLYENIVWSTLSYGAAVWGTKQFSCINAIQSRAARFFLGVGKYSPNAGVLGDTGWEPVIAKQWKVVTNHWIRMRLMDENRINARVFRWAESKSGRGCKNWNFRVKQSFEEANIHVHVDDRIGDGHHLKVRMFTHFFEKFKANWENDINRDTARSNNGGNKLRLYRNFKSVYNIDAYVTCLMPRSHRSALSKFRLGVAPIRIETGRYERLSVSERICFHCKSCVEDELHVLLNCPLYDELRSNFYQSLQVIGINMDEKSPISQFNFILNSLDEKLIRMSAKFCCEILTRRRKALYK